MFLNFIFLFTPIVFTGKIPGNRMTPPEEMVLTVSVVSLALWSESHIGSRSAIQGQEQRVHKKMMDIKIFLGFGCRGISFSEN